MADATVSLFSFCPTGLFVWEIYQFCDIGKVVKIGENFARW